MTRVAAWIGGMILAAGAIRLRSRPGQPWPHRPPAGQPARRQKPAGAAGRKGSHRRAWAGPRLVRIRNVTSYTCTLLQQERVDPAGPMGPLEKMLCRCMERPFSVFLDAVENPVGARKALYVQGQWNNMMLVKPAGLGRSWHEPAGSSARPAGPGRIRCGPSTSSASSEPRSR